MLIQQNGEFKRSVFLEGYVDRIDMAPVRKVIGKDLTTYQFRVTVEFESTPEKVSKRSVYCNYYVRNKDENKQGSAKLISTLKVNERIICFGTASASKMYTDEKVNAKAPLSVSVGSFILPDRTNALIANLTNYEETAIDIEDEGVFDNDRKQERLTRRRSQNAYAKKPKNKAKPKENKYAFE